MNICSLLDDFLFFLKILFVYASVYVSDRIKSRNNMFVVNPFKELSTVSFLNNLFLLKDTGGIWSSEEDRITVSKTDQTVKQVTQRSGEVFILEDIKNLTENPTAVGAAAALSSGLQWAVSRGANFKYSVTATTVSQGNGSFVLCTVQRALFSCWGKC